jgi:hypothetical protein
MSDSINQNIDNEELDLKQLEDVSGGRIVNPNNSGINNYEVFDDNTGEIISEEYKKRFGKDI